MDRTADQVRVVPDNGAGPGRFGEITFENDAYEYTVSYGYELFDDAGDLRDRDETFQRALIVRKVGDFADRVFDETCDPNHAADSIFFLERS